MIFILLLLCSCDPFNTRKDREFKSAFVGATLSKRQINLDSNKGYDELANKENISRSDFDDVWTFMQTFNKRHNQVNVKLIKDSAFRLELSPVDETQYYVANEDQKRTLKKHYEGIAFGTIDLSVEDKNVLSSKLYSLLIPKKELIEDLALDKDSLKCLNKFTLARKYTLVKQETKYSLKVYIVIQDKETKKQASMLVGSIEC